MMPPTMDRAAILKQAIDETRQVIQQVMAAGRKSAQTSPEVAAWILAMPAQTADAAPAVQESVTAFESGFVYAAPPPPEPVAPPPAKTADVSPAPPPNRSKLSAEDLAALDALRSEVAACTRCDLCKTRTQTVFSDGTPHADVVFVGEAPGEQEDLQGTPFVGRAGQLLTDIITKGMGLQRDDVYICNVLKCRPPNNRDPLPTEKDLCESFLVRQLDLVRPKVICALGAHAAKTLLKTDEATGRLRGKWHFYHGIPLRVTYHPAYLLRSPGEKKKTWQDIQEVMKVLRGEIDPRPDSPFHSFTG